jgi:hypothetical protein
MGFKETIEKAADSVVRTLKETIGIEEKEDKEAYSSREFGRSPLEETEPEIPTEHPEVLYMDEGQHVEHLSEYLGLGFGRDFTNQISELLNFRDEELMVRPNVEVWPFEDEFGLWKLSHRDPSRAVVCGTPEFKDSPYCGLGVH